MKPNADKSQSKVNATDDLKSLPMPELQAKLKSSPEGLSQVVGFWEERQAGNAIAALMGKLAIKARVKRDGKWTTLAARQRVPGDFIRLRLSNIVPEDPHALRVPDREIPRLPAPRLHYDSPPMFLR